VCVKERRRWALKVYLLKIGFVRQTLTLSGCDARATAENAKLEAACGIARDGGLMKVKHMRPIGDLPNHALG
jgi:hypothetical protein